MSITEKEFTELYTDLYERDSNKNKCMICYDTNDLIKLSCNHYYHDKCLNLYYLKGKKTFFNCPYCNKKNKFIKCKNCKKINLTNNCSSCNINPDNISNVIDKNKENSKSEINNCCTAIIKSGINKGKICGRELKNEKCRYHTK